jgi:RpiR family carbohydrate utilization transcriptional regulator
LLPPILPEVITISTKEPALILKMKALYDSLGTAEKKVIDYIVAHPEEVIYLSVTGLAEKSGASIATVIRACRKIGMNGYQELKVNLAQDIVTPLQNIHEEVNEDDTPSVILDKIFQSSMYALQFTRDVINIKAIEAATQSLLNAKKVNIYGLGNSHSIAIDMQHKMMRLGINATAYTDSHMQSIASAYLNKDDVVVGISHSGSSKDVVDAVNVAKKNGATVICITNFGRSPLSDLADIKLYTASKETKYRIVALASRVAQITIIDTLYTMLALARKAEIVDGFHNVEIALKDKKY